MNPGQNLKRLLGWKYMSSAILIKRSWKIGKIVKDAIMQCEDAPSRNSSDLLKGITIGIILD
jgi:hypothetical protein